MATETAAKSPLSMPRSPGRPKRREVAIEDSLVAGGWRLFAFDQKTWAVEPIGVSKKSAERKRRYFHTFSAGLSDLFDIQIIENERALVHAVSTEYRALTQNLLALAARLGLEQLMEVSPKRLKTPGTTPTPEDYRLTA